MVRHANRKQGTTGLCSLHCFRRPVPVKGSGGFLNSACEVGVKNLGQGHRCRGRGLYATTARSRFRRKSPRWATKGHASGAFSMTLNNTNPSSEAAAAGSPNQMYIPDEVYSPSIEITCNIGALITRIGSFGIIL